MRHSGKAETFWAAFLKSMVRRGLHGTKLMISNLHEGLKAAIRRVMDLKWQRCSDFMSRPVAYLWELDCTHSTCLE